MINSENELHNFKGSFSDIFFDSHFNFTSNEGNDTQKNTNSICGIIFENAINQTHENVNTNNGEKKRRIEVSEPIKKTFFQNLELKERLNNVLHENQILLINNQNLNGFNAFLKEAINEKYKELEQLSKKSEETEGDLKNRIKFLEETISLKNKTIEKHETLINNQSSIISNQQSAINIQTNAIFNFVTQKFQQAPNYYQPQDIEQNQNNMNRLANDPKSQNLL